MLLGRLTESSCSDVMRGYTFLNVPLGTQAFIEIKNPDPGGLLGKRSSLEWLHSATNRRVKANSSCSRAYLWWCSAEIASTISRDTPATALVAVLRRLQAEAIAQTRLRRAQL